VARNAAHHLSFTLTSLVNQTIRPAAIVVVNDGSSDETSEILAKATLKHPIIRVLDLPDRGYDIRRVPANINLAIASANELQTEYLMISGDDCTYPTDYFEAVVQGMDRNVRIVVASGRPSQSGVVAQEHSPSGSGRIVRSSFLDRVGNRFPVRAGWEAWLLYRAAQMGFETKLFDDLFYEHLRPRGSTHQFTYWGAAMYTLGYHPLYAMGRVAKNLVKRSPRSALFLIRGYLTAALGSSDSFTKLFEPSLRKFVSRQQGREIGRRVVSVISRGIG
jgi:glycosyltransferase involved in cell wall biosynthesis